MNDAQLGELMRKLSERPGDFPSRNFVSNETSLLDVAPALRDGRLRGRAYVGVGPEQNLTYVGLSEPEIAYVVDIRRGNALELVFLRACMERGESRVQFVSALTSRGVPRALVDAQEPVTVQQIAEAFRGAKPEASLRDEAMASAQAWMERLGWIASAAELAELRVIRDAFATKGLELAYSMEGSARKYPSLGSLLALETDQGEAATFLGTEERYRRVRAFVIANRLVPVVGDFAGSHALKGVANDITERGLKLGVFYTSNVEQYLFEGTAYARFTTNVRAMPSDEASVIVRVWFDQGRRHPKQRSGHRTTTVVAPLGRFLERAGSGAYKTYWSVVTDST